MNIDFAIGLHIVGFLASREGKLTSSTIMAKSFGTSPVVLRRVLSRLNQSDLVETKRGANGGSVLARPATTINLREIYESVCVVSELFARHPKGEGAVSNVIGGYINDVYSEAEKVMLSHLESTSVADMDAELRPRIITALNCK
jgi:Rrf2 family protein